MGKGVLMTRSAQVAARGGKAKPAGKSRTEVRRRPAVVKPTAPAELTTGRMVLSAFVAAVVSLVHVSVVTGPGVTFSPAAFYLLVAVPGLLHLAVWPAQTARTSYRWVVVWALMLTSLLPQLVLLLGQAWVMWRAHYERARSGPAGRGGISEGVGAWVKRVRR